MSNNNEEITEVTTNDKPKNPNRVAWAIKLGQMNKGKKKSSTEENTNNLIYYAPILIGGISIAAFVLYYTRATLSRDAAKTTEVEQQVNKPKLKKQNLEI